MLGQILPQPDDIGHRPIGDQGAEATFFTTYIKNELGVARHAFELAQVANQPRILHQVLQALGAHQHHLFWIEAKEHLLERRPLGVHQAVLETGAEDTQADQRQITVITQRPQFRIAARLRQHGLQRLGRAETVEAELVQPLVITHESNPS